MGRQWAACTRASDREASCAHADEQAGAQRSGRAKLLLGAAAQLAHGVCGGGGGGGGGGSIKFTNCNIHVTCDVIKSSLM